MPELIEIDEARRLIAERVTRTGAEAVPVAAALGRVLAEDVSSTDDVPGFDNSAMDGFAVRTADAAHVPAELAVVDESSAGHPASRAVDTGQAIAISTGAVVPHGADAVVRVEDTAREGDRVTVQVAPEEGQNIRRAGEDIGAGETVMREGTNLGPAEIGVLASVGLGEVPCARRPQVSVLTTGDELQEPGAPLRPGAIRNSNAHSIAASVTEAGADLAAVRLVRDDRDKTLTALEPALAGAVTIICGGVSVGEHDHVRPVLAELGVEQVFWGVALRPGKPTFFGVAPGGGLVFGLPGNPVSALVTFHLFVKPALQAMLGATRRRRVASAVLDADYAKRPGRAHLVRCTVELSDDGWHATPTGPQGSHVLTSMLGAEALALIPSDRGDVKAGERVDIEWLR